jgi:hypothetical protein
MTHQSSLHNNTYTTIPIKSFFYTDKEGNKLLNTDQDLATSHTRVHNTLAILFLTFFFTRYRQLNEMFLDSWAAHIILSLVYRRTNMRPELTLCRLIWSAPFSFFIKNKGFSTSYTDSIFYLSTSHTLFWTLGNYCNTASSYTYTNNHTFTTYLPLAIDTMKPFSVYLVQHTRQGLLALHTSTGQFY